MKQMKEHFRRLGLREDASWEEIEAAFNRKIKELRIRTFEDDPKGKKKDKERRLLIRSYYALQEYEENGRVIKRGLSNPSNKSALNLLLVGILVLIAVVSCSHNFDTYEDEVAEGYARLNVCANAAKEDLQIAEIAAKTVETLDNAGTPWHTSTGGRHYTESDEVILEEADRFAKCYWNMEHFADVEDYLCENYENFRQQYDAVDEGEDFALRTRVDMVCAFYGFYTKEQAFGLKNPYTKKGIGQYHTYLQYLQRYKEAA